MITIIITITITYKVTYRPMLVYISKYMADFVNMIYIKVYIWYTIQIYRGIYMYMGIDLLCIANTHICVLAYICA